MNETLKGVIEHELKNPVVKGIGNESIIGIIDLGVEVTHPDEIDVVQMKLRIPIVRFVEAILEHMDWVDTKDPVTSRDFYNAYDNRAVYGLWDKLERTASRWTEDGGIRTFSLEQDAESAVGLSKKDASLNHMYVVLVVWPTDAIQSMEIHVLSVPRMLKNALEGHYTLLEY